MVFVLLGVTSFDGNAGWLNGPPPSPASLQGKVVLVDFWEYTCLNCLRTLPYLKEWYGRYRDDGFTIVGVHSPEFAFSGERANVEAAVRRLGVTWPVVLDDDLAIWKRYGNQAWPGEYLFDRNGTLVEHVTGEGRYQETEAKIQAVLREGNPQLRFPPVMALLPQDSYDKPGAVCYLKTPEVLVEAQPIAESASFRDASGARSFTDPDKHDDGRVYLQGFWRVTQQGVVSAGGSGYAALRYHAIAVETVLRPENGETIRVTVTQDGKPVAHADAGSDLHYDANGNSYLNVDAPRGYDVVDNAAFGTHELRLSPDKLGLGIYDFAFEACEVPAAGRNAS